MLKLMTNNNNTEMNTDYEHTINSTMVFILVLLKFLEVPLGGGEKLLSSAVFHPCTTIFRKKVGNFCKGYLRLSIILLTYVLVYTYMLDERFNITWTPSQSNFHRFIYFTVTEIYFEIFRYYRINFSKTKETNYMFR